MKYDANFPLKLGEHVIVDRRSGATYTSDRHSAVLAMSQTLQSVTQGDFEALSDDHKMSLVEFVRKVAVSALLSGEKPEFGDVLTVGPFETQNCCIHLKNMMLAEQTVRKADPALADWLQKELLDDDETEDGADPIESMLKSVFGGDGVEVKVHRMDLGGGGVGGLSSLLDAIRRNR